MMNRIERLNTVLKGGIPDRVPCIPLIYYFAATYSHTPYPEFITSVYAFRRALDKCFQEIGPWDALYTLPITMDAPDYQIVWSAGVGTKPSFPSDSGSQIQPFQVKSEESLIDEKDYPEILKYNDFLEANPYLKFMELLVSRASGRKRSLDFLLGQLLLNFLRLGVNWIGEIIRWRIRGVPVFPGFSLESPFDTLSMARGFKEFCCDLFWRPDEVEEVVMKLSRSYAAIARRVCQILGINNFIIMVHRSSNYFIAPSHYERFVHPSLKYITEALGRYGIITGLHCDGNWNKNFEYMVDLPENTYLQLDGFSDIFLARRIFGNRFTLMGDLHPTALVLSTPSEIRAYCLRLIREVGKEGRFILSSGCEVPPNANPENVRAMIETARDFGQYG